MLTVASHVPFPRERTMPRMLLYINYNLHYFYHRLLWSQRVPSPGGGVSRGERGWTAPHRVLLLFIASVNELCVSRVEFVLWRTDLF